MTTLLRIMPFINYNPLLIARYKILRLVTILERYEKCASANPKAGNASTTYAYAQEIFSHSARHFFFFVIRGSPYYREWIFSSFFINRRRSFALTARANPSIVMHRMLRSFNEKKWWKARKRERKGEL